MRRVVYGMGVVITTDEVADALCGLAVALANLGQFERITIPVVIAELDADATVDLFVGPGIPVLSEPVSWQGPEPDFSTGAALLRVHPAYPYHFPAASCDPPLFDDRHHWDPDLDGY